MSPKNAVEWNGLLPVTLNFGNYVRDHYLVIAPIWVLNNPVISHNLNPSNVHELVFIIKNIYIFLFFIKFGRKSKL